MNVLLLSFSLHVPYRVLRCAHALGLTVFVLGSREARGLTRSRYCAGFADLASDGSDPAALAAELERQADRLGCGMVLPSDHPSFGLMSRMQGMLAVPVFPMPDRRSFEVLNDKYAFGQHCRSLGVPYPHTVLLPDVGAVHRAIADGQLALPLVLKPPAMDGGSGVLVIRSAAELGKLDEVDYRPVLAQAYIDGKDVDSTVYAEGGRVRVAQSYHRDGWRLMFDRDERLLEQSTRIIEALGADGVFNFDARIGRDGTVYMIECNPRFFYTMDYAALAGVNYVGLGLQSVFGRTQATEAPAAPRQVSFWPPVATLKRFVTLRWPSGDDFRMLRHFLADPLLPLIYEEIPWRAKKAASLAF